MPESPSGAGGGVTTAELVGPFPRCYRRPVQPAKYPPGHPLRHLPRHLPPLGLIAALLALAGQIAFAAALPRPILAAIAFGRLCQTDSHGRAPTQPRRQVPPRAVSPLCRAMALPATPLAAPPALPAPRRLAAIAATVPPRTVVPPPPISLAAPPRGPPGLA
jgi:hypothetical protein